MFFAALSRLMGGGRIVSAEEQCIFLRRRPIVTLTDEGHTSPEGLPWAFVVLVDPSYTSGLVSQSVHENFCSSSGMLLFFSSA